MTTRRPFPSDRYDDGVFRLGREYGLLPEVPLERLPARFDALQAILDELPAVLDAERDRLGLLGRPEAVAVAAETLPDFEPEIVALDASDPDDLRVLVALFRGYAFLAAAYVLEPAIRGRPAGTSLPPHVARPLVHTADVLGLPPWLDEHFAWSLHDWALIDPDVPADDRLRWDNLRPCVRLTGSAAEMVLVRSQVHVAAHTGPLIGSLLDALDAARRVHEGEDADDALTDALRELLDALATVRAALDDVDRAARACPPDPHLRVFRAGARGEVLGNGVIFEGVDRLRGEPWRPGPPSSVRDDVLALVDALTGTSAPRAPASPAVTRLLDDVEEAARTLDLPARLRRDRADLFRRLLAAADRLRDAPAHVAAEPASVT